MCKFTQVAGKHLVGVKSIGAPNLYTAGQLLRLKTKLLDSPICYDMKKYVTS